MAPAAAVAFNAIATLKMNIYSPFPNWLTATSAPSPKDTTKHDLTVPFDACNSAARPQGDRARFLQTVALPPRGRTIR